MLVFDYWNLSFILFSNLILLYLLTFKIKFVPYKLKLSNTCPIEITFSPVTYYFMDLDNLETCLLWNTLLFHLVFVLGRLAIYVCTFIIYM